MKTFVGPNGRIYRKPPRRRWPALALIGAVLMVAGITVNVMHPVKQVFADVR